MWEEADGVGCRIPVPVLPRTKLTQAELFLVMRRRAGFVNRAEAAAALGISTGELRAIEHSPRRSLSTAARIALRTLGMIAGHAPTDDV